MKALILAGHVGTRPRPHGHAVPVANRPVLSYGLESIRKAGVCEIAIVVSARSGTAVREHVGTGAAFGLDVTYLQQDDAGLPSGLASRPASGLGACVLVARDYLGDDGPHTSLGPDCEVDSSTVEHSIVLEGASLRGVGPLRNSLIGRDARVRAEPAGARLVLADHSQVLLPADVTP